MIGRRLGHYRIDRKLGEGGVGVVYRAVDELLGRVVALKVLLAELHSRPDVVERFRSEARTLARLNHPNVATLYSFEELEGSLAMVMEFVEGMTLANLTQGAGRLPPEHALPIFFQALDGIGHAHSLGIVHRDIKGSNLMLDTRGELKVMDFGIARIVGSERHTQLGHVVGTPEFMAPEQIRGDETDTRADVYSLGILLFLLLTGRTPFVGGSGFELMRAQVEEPPPALRSLAPELPEGLDAVVAGALEKDPDARIPSCQAFREALAPFAPAVERRLRGPGPVEVLARPDWRTASLEVALEGGAATALLSDAGQGAGSDAVASRDEPSLPVPAALHAHSHSESHSEAPTHRHPVSSPRLWRRPWLWGALLMACAGLNVVWWGRPAMDTPLAPDASLVRPRARPPYPRPRMGPCRLSRSRPPRAPTLE